MTGVANTERLLCAGRCSNAFPTEPHLVLTATPEVLTTDNPVVQIRKLRPERVKNLPNNRKLVNGLAGIASLAFWLIANQR